jgi:hypothetical protein
MVEKTLVKEQLTSEMAEAGAALTRKLDELGLRATAAFWFFMPDINEWRLLFASPEVSAKGPRAVYDRIRIAIEQLGEIGTSVPLSAIGLLDDNAELIGLLRRVLNTGPGIGRVRFSKNVIDGHFIDDALIYRIV